MDTDISEAILRHNSVISKMLDLFEKLAMNMINIEKRLIDLEAKNK